MRKFWGFYDNGHYQVGCNGASMYLYDQNGAELKRFRDIPYGYTGAFKPNTDIFVLHSNAGLLAVYDLEQRTLLKKFRLCPYDSTQDQGFCFSPNGKLFCHIDQIGIHTRLSIYETQEFTLVERRFEAPTTPELNAIEYDETQKRYAVLGYTRSPEGVYQQGFVAALEGENLCDVQNITNKEHQFIRSYKTLQLFGFTKKAMEWSALRYEGYTDAEIGALVTMKLDLLSFPSRAKEVMPIKPPAPRHPNEAVSAWFENPERVSEMAAGNQNKLKKWEKLVVERFPKGAKILDVGCGMGREAFALADLGFSVTGIDISAEAIRRVTRLAAQSGRDIPFLLYDGRALPFEAETFDVVVIWSQTFGLLYGDTYKIVFLMECGRVLKTGGLLSFSGHDLDYLNENYPDCVREGNFYPYANTNLYWETFCAVTLTAFAMASGFRVLRCEKGEIYRLEDGTVLHCLCEKPSGESALL